MKNLILFLAFFIFGVTYSQQGIQSFSVDTIKGAQTKYATSTKQVAYNGFVTFEFTADGFNTDSATFILQGSNNSWTTYQDISTQAYKSATATSYLLSDNPAKYLRYRIKMVGKATDTVRVSNLLFIYKR